PGCRRERRPQGHVQVFVSVPGSCRNRAPATLPDADDELSSYTAEAEPEVADVSIHRPCSLAPKGLADCVRVKRRVPPLLSAVSSKSRFLICEICVLLIW